MLGFAAAEHGFSLRRQGGRHGLFVLFVFVASLFFVVWSHASHPRNSWLLKKLPKLFA